MGEKTTASRKKDAQKLTFLGDQKNSKVRNLAEGVEGNKDKPNTGGISEKRSWEGGATPVGRSDALCVANTSPKWGIEQIPKPTPRGSLPHALRRQ